MPELTDAQKVVRNDTAKRMAVALEVLAGTGGRGLPAGGTDGDVLVKNGATDYAANWTNTPSQMGSLAYIETTSSVSKQGGYQPGEYLVYNGQLYKVGGTAIGQGETLNPGQGGNIEAVENGGINQLSSEINNINNILSGSDFLGTATAILSAGLCSCFLIGKLFVANIYAQFAVNANAGDVLFNLSAQDLPTTFSITSFPTISSTGNIAYRIRTDKNLRTISADMSIPQGTKLFGQIISKLN